MLTLEHDKTAKRLVDFLQKSFADTGFSRAAIALSGGVDSATSCALAVQALGAGNIYPLLLPYGQLNERGVNDAKLVLKTLKIPEENVSLIDIQPLIDPFLATDTDMDQVRKGNAMARMRMTVIFDLAKKLKALVVGTENKTECLLGYFTRFGDEASDIEPLIGLYKAQVYELAKFLGIPEPILTKPPTAGLWPGQTDEGEFGFTYKDADQILSLLFDEKKSVEEIVAAGLPAGRQVFPKEVVTKVKARVDQNSFKHHLPIIL